VVSCQTILMTQKVCFGFWVSRGGDALNVVSRDEDTSTEMFVCLQCGYSIRCCNTSKVSSSFRRAGSGVIFGLVSLACGGLRFDSPGVSLLFLGRDPAFQNNAAASKNVTRWLRSETWVWIRNKQARTFLQQYGHMKERGNS
jgi:hypothetical protein